eukprot:TRINITY_DN2076_c0_g1_i6.p1 TRINITY_DN2076_c0_g1~~TRINITY_DN2076_c0_g1_i6.p1  ORF type:complete len:157 (+),score=23.41 TRINITY_DN2076_c0_g1_i6:108-578(+)
MKNVEGNSYTVDGYCPVGQHRAYDWEITDQTTLLQTMVFNTFVFCQVFNSVNSRKVNNEWKVWEHLMANWVFDLLLVLTVIIQVFLVIFTGQWMGVSSFPGLNGFQWLSCLVLAVVTLPLGMLAPLIPVPKTKQLPRGESETAPLLSEELSIVSSY